MGIKGVIDSLVSLRTSVWLLVLLVIMFIAGAFVMPASERFLSIHSLPLLQWMQEQPFIITWWLWGILCILVALTVNTLFCSIDSLLKKKAVTQWLLLISPQIIHLGFLFMLLAHLMSAIDGFKGLAVAREGTLLDLPNGTGVQITKIAVSFDATGHMRDWAVDVSYFSEGRRLSDDRLRPNKPSFHKGIGIYVKDLRAFPEKAALLEISREPGAVCALTGAIFFMAGTITLLIFKTRREGAIRDS